MIEAYRSGYMRCLVDLVNVCNTTEVLGLKSGRRMRAFIESLMSALVGNPEAFDEWIKCGGNFTHMKHKVDISSEGEVKIK